MKSEQRSKSRFIKGIIIWLCVFSLVFCGSCGRVENPAGAKSNVNTSSGGIENNSNLNPDKIENDLNTSSGGIESIIKDNEKLEAAFSYKGKDYGFRKDIKTYLVLGIDRYGEIKKTDEYIGMGQCDAIYLLVLDSGNKKCSVLQLDRDAMVEMNILGVFGDVVGSEVQQLALAHAYGDGGALSCKNCVDAISKWLKGIPVSGYAALQFDALAILNDDIGGVEVYIEDDWSSVDSSLIKGSKVKLLGEHAFNFVHARQGMPDDNNTSRMRRQRTYLSSFRTRFMEMFKESSGIVNTMYSDVKPYMCTDMSLGTISNIAAKTIDYSFAGFVNIKGTSKVATHSSGLEFVEFWADEASLNETVINLFCKEVK